MSIEGVTGLPGKFGRILEAARRRGARVVIGAGTTHIGTVLVVDADLVCVEREGGRSAVTVRLDRVETVEMFAEREDAGTGEGREAFRTSVVEVFHSLGAAADAGPA